MFTVCYPSDLGHFFRHFVHNTSHACNESLTSELYCYNEEAYNDRMNGLMGKNDVMNDKSRFLFYFNFPIQRNCSDFHPNIAQE